MGYTNTIWAVGDIAGMVRDARRHLHLTQADIAARTGISRPWISQFEKGKITNPSFDRLLKVCDAVDIRLSGTYGPRHDQENQAGNKYIDKTESPHLNEVIPNAAMGKRLSSSLSHIASLIQAPDFSSTYQLIAEKYSKQLHEQSKALSDMVKSLGQNRLRSAFASIDPQLTTRILSQPTAIEQIAQKEEKSDSKHSQEEN